MGVVAVLAHAPPHLVYHHCRHCILARSAGPHVCTPSRVCHAPDCTQKPGLAPLADLQQELHPASDATAGLLPLSNIYWMPEYVWVAVSAAERNVEPLSHCDLPGTDLPAFTSE